MDDDYYREPTFEREPQPLPPAWGAPVSGGTILVMRDGLHAVLADPDRNRVMVVTLEGQTATQIALQPGDEPGRLIEDGAGRVHIALRGGGALLTLDAALTNVAARRPVCAEPRGVAWEAERDVVHVACTGGELVTLKAEGGPALRTLHLDRDLRDVIVNRDKLVVSRFRSAELLYIDPKGNVVARKTSPVTSRLVPSSPTAMPPFPPTPPAVSREAVGAVAWRSVALSDGGVLMLHQRAVETPLSAKPGGYGGGGGPGGPGPDPFCTNTCCFRSLNEAALTVLRPDLPPVAVRPVLNGAVPVDVAVSDGRKQVAVALAGRRNIQVISTELLERVDDPACVDFDPDFSEVLMLEADLGIPTSVAWTPSGSLLTFYPEAPALLVRSGPMLDQMRKIPLPGNRASDIGRELFHRQTESGLACASCHPEAREDGRAWTIGSGKVRTQSLSGHLLARSPYHWVGDMFDLGVLLQDVFTQRMSGGPVFETEVRSLGQWLDRIPAPKASPPADVAAVARGKALFESPMVGCDSCHGGPILTRNQRFDVGTRGIFKAPSLLGVSARAPFMHDGCAPTLRDRFGTCGGGNKHGTTSQLTTAQIDDLVAFLESL